MESQRTSAFPALTAVFVTGAAFLARFGYRFGYSDQDEFLPWLSCKLYDGPVCADWFVSLQQSGFNVRSGFVGMLHPGASALGIPVTVAIAQAGAFAAVCWATYRLAFWISGRASVSVASVPVSLALLFRWTLGGNEAIGTMLVPSTVAWALSLWALVMVLERRTLTAGILIGAAAWIQLLVAFWLGFAGLVVTVLLHSTDSWRTVRPSVLRYAAPAVLLALPVALLLTLNRFSSSLDLYLVMAQFRAPHHYLPSAFPAPDWLRVGAIHAVAILLMLIGALRARKAEKMHVVWALVLLGVLIPALVGFGSEFYRSWGLAALQPFKLTVLSKIILVPVALLGITRLFPFGIELATLGDRIATSKITTLLAFLVLGTAVGLMKPDVPPQGVFLGRWAGAALPDDARFALPPSLSGFRFAADRPVFVTFKAYPFDAGDVDQWLNRLREQGTTPEMGAMRTEVALARMDSAWEALPAAGLIALMRHNGLTHAIRQTPLDSTAQSLELVGRLDPFDIYRLQPMGAP